MEPIINEFKHNQIYIRQYITQCLSQMTYYIESEGKAVIIDPMRDYYRYLEILNDRKAELKYILMTHIHADFVSSHIELQQKTKAPIVYGPTAQVGYKTEIASDGQILELGKIKIKIIHTPGHTNESSCFLLLDENLQEYCVFTGDTLFLGDVGRPDLCQNTVTTKELQAEKLYISLQNKIKTLNSKNIVFPAHGAGSSCGKNISDKTHDILENQLQQNWALQNNLTLDQFIINVTNITDPPIYYFYDAKINKEGYTSQLDEIVKKSYVPLKPIEVKELLKNQNYLLIDCRKNSEFISEYIPYSLFLSLDMPFAQWIGCLVSPSQNIIILVPEDQEKAAILRLARIGYENVKGFLKGGFQAWKKEGFEVKKGQNISSQDLVQKIQKNEKFTLLDVRKPQELESVGKIENSINVELAILQKELEKNNHLFNNNENLYIFCRSGVRSVVAYSILEKFGYQNIVNVLGGFTDVSKFNIPQVIKGQCTANKA
ncbi:metallo-beta-lactamase protein, putative [Ichthyophthirius multifiliis]|uniref:Metallo-beta-lactamase protein, putative n=1 Tax=Ichthyophthirius multifiliis TaxID=5932 RepID=G0QK77_ICHMU|nr:metallo-beta-lactamase protein, putative [Ichthyophthirius multifiliis]EGR34375.1 metallo-beta-lactamase protein, putative [Ichthyophthirius multifiliis]|eukprot:XP_004039679.1 metallo-beta-lactamase protein, putative [Ichthyophthirius multifiliis]